MMGVFIFLLILLNYFVKLLVYNFTKKGRWDISKS